ncbi:sensor domain-containing protein [Mycobacterium sp. 155]|uniref:sensor domain-containing protein n=1 Tax=Mycobacterium sp. 155 TaxID=1157943 RepID=UPI00039C6510|nr:sensor domain-containing protein [Mycobacterium sp. 155]
MRTVGALGLLVSAVMLTSGCTKIVDGNVAAADGLAPRPLSGQSVEKALPDIGQVEKIVGESLTEDTYVPSISGGLDDLPDGLATEQDATPHECVGVSSPMQRSTYESADVTGAASTQWKGDESDGAVLAVDVGVVALGSVADANALFAEFAKQWKDCQGQTVTLVRESVRGGFYTDAITDVRSTGSVVAATVEFGHTTDKSTSPVARAVGVKANCLVEAEIAYYSDAVTSGKPSDVDTVAIDIARAMMERVEELT